MSDHIHRFRGPHTPDPDTVDRVARGLGWFSIGLGLMELCGARSLARTLGMEGREGLIAAFGARELAAGAAILGVRNPEPGVWSRVAGDALDLAVLAGELRDNPQRRNVEIALGAVIGATLADLWCAKALRDERRAIEPLSGRIPPDPLL